jgi:hypothetical protein
VQNYRLTFEAGDKDTAASVVHTIVQEATPFDIQGTKIQHELGAIEMRDAIVTDVAVNDIVEDADAT